MSQRNHIRRGFSLIELVIVVVIIGIIAAIAIPRLSRGATGAADSAAAANLAMLRSAIDLYAAEHNSAFPDATNYVKQLTYWSDVSGGTFSTSKDTTNGIVYGPYLRKIPTCPVGPKAIQNSTFLDGSTNATPTGAAAGWWYNKSTGEIKINLPSGTVDSTGVDYSTY